jgi:Skp family chaperone for outer membrane proteins
MHMHHLYDYSRFQTLADRKTIEASHANQRAVLLAIAIAVLVSLFFFVRKQAVKKLKIVNTDYVNTLILYNKVKDELQSQQNNNAKELQQAESELQRLKEQLATAQQDKHTPDKWDMNSELLNSYIYLEFHQAAAKGKTMPTEKWEQLRRMVNAKMPRFMEAISTLDYFPDLFETQLVILIKLRFLVSEIAVLLDVPTYTLTKRRKRLLKLMFKTDGTADEFDRRISVLGVDETNAF